MTRLAVMQPYAFPYLGYFRLAQAVDRFVFYDDVAFRKRGWIARNRVLVNDNVLTFTIPVTQASSFRAIRDTTLHPVEFPRWRSRFLRTLAQAYARAPYKTDAIGLVESILQVPCDSIADLARESVVRISRHVHLSTSFLPTSAAYGNATLKAQARIIDICRREGATDYVNAPGGTALYDPRAFAAAGVRLSFIVPPSTDRMDGDRPPNLSIIDTLMFHGPDDVRRLLAQSSVITPALDRDDLA